MLKCGPTVQSYRDCKVGTNFTVLCYYLVILFPPNLTIFVQKKLVGKLLKSVLNWLKEYFKDRKNLPVPVFCWIYLNYKWKGSVENILKKKPGSGNEPLHLNEWSIFLNEILYLVSVCHLLLHRNISKYKSNIYYHTHVKHFIKLV